MNEKALKLRKFMTAHNLGAKDVASLIHVSTQTVYAWRMDQNERDISEHQFSKLRERVKNGKDRKKAGIT